MHSNVVVENKCDFHPMSLTSWNPIKYVVDTHIMRDNLARIPPYALQHAHQQDKPTESDTYNLARLLEKILKIMEFAVGEFPDILVEGAFVNTTYSSFL